MANAFDMFKKMQKLIVPDYSDYTELTRGEQFTCPSDGFLFASVHAQDGGNRNLLIAINGISNIKIEANDWSYGEALLPLSSGDKVIYTTSSTSKITAYAHFFAAREN